MNREIKFRAWCKEISWRNGEEITEYYMENDIETIKLEKTENYPMGCFIGKLGRWCGVHEAVFMQFTGLTDRNIKDIYEGDIVKVYFNEARIGAKAENYLYVVEFIKSTASFELVGHDELLGKPCLAVGNQYIMEVVGNIFENPELLEGGNV